MAQKFQSESVLDARRTSLEAAEARLEQVRAGAALAGNQAAYATLEADRDGVVIWPPWPSPAGAGRGQAVVRLAQEGASRSPDQYSREPARAGERGYRRTSATLADQSRQLAGRVREVAPAADAATRTYAVRVTVEGPANPCRSVPPPWWASPPRRAVPCCCRSPQ